jgi:hypothetical protein
MNPWTSTVTPTPPQSYEAATKDNFNLLRIWISLKNDARQQTAQCSLFVFKWHNNRAPQNNVTVVLVTAVLRQLPPDVPT